MIDFSKTLFLDIETASQVKDYSQLSERMQKLWDHKAEQIAKGGESATPESLYERAAIYAEFGKIICISVGFFNDQRFRLKSFYGHDEKALLTEFATLLDRYYAFP
ncbi:MAG: 3'-5' exonuclease, partial [Bacteroidales bacterium]|nr:3'-5' exonuclease [Bacteroidales bacterium]